MKHFGLFGEHLTHSISPQIHEYVYKKINMDADYSLIEFPEHLLESNVKNLQAKNIEGINVTIPYKKSIINYLDSIDELASSIGSVNTICITEKGLTGYNTDYYGIVSTLDDYLPLANENFLILGYGGASLPLIHYLIEQNAKKIYIASRDPKNSKKNLESIIGVDSVNNEVEFIDYEYIDSVSGKIIFNSTPLGMYPNEDTSPIDKKYLLNFQIAIDLIYNPVETRFLKDARESGLQCQNGLKMLVYQAIKSIEIWLDKKIDSMIYQETYDYFNHKNILENSNRTTLKANLDPVYIVGLPASGKTTLGKLLSEYLDLKFIDLDEYIENMTHKTINKIFEDEGEKSFRDYETKALYQTGNMKNTVISTGGGAVVTKENRQLLQNSKQVFYIARDCQTIIDTCSMKNRPLLKDNPMKIFDLFEQRKDLYKQVSDKTIHNNSNIVTPLFDMVYSVIAWATEVDNAK